MPPLLPWWLAPADSARLPPWPVPLVPAEMTMSPAAPSTALPGVGVGWDGVGMETTRRQTNDEGGEIKERGEKSDRKKKRETKS